MTGHLIGDASQVAPLLEKIPSKISLVKGDGEYDDARLRRFLSEKEIKCLFPPHKKAKLSKNYKCNPSQRDLDIIRIRKDGRDIWTYASGYSRRNMVENTISRFKQIIDPKLRSKTIKNQQTEIALSVEIINQMTRLGMPNSVRVR